MLALAARQTDAGQISDVTLYRFKIAQAAGEHGVRAVKLDIEISELVTAGFGQATTDGDPVAVGTHVISGWAQGNRRLSYVHPRSGKIPV